MSMLNHKMMLRGLNYPLVQKAIWAEYANINLLLKRHKVHNSIKHLKSAIKIKEMLL